MGDRVATPDIEQLRRNVREGRDDVSWGPNSTFRFPLRGGTGAIWTAIAGLLPAERLHFGADVVSLSVADRSIHLQDGRRVAWDTLISTMPLDVLCERVDGLSAAARTAARRLLHSAVHVVGVGLRGPCPATLARKCWMYFPEATSPYYRVTVFSNYSSHNVPPGGDHWSLMAEVCETPHRPVDAATIARDTVHGLRRDGLVAPATEVVSVWHYRAEHGYPTPSVTRDSALATVLPELERHRIFSRGRFGAWRYEVSNQDHSCMQGVELVDRLLGIGEGHEPTVSQPSLASKDARGRGLGGAE
jgi:protoporphyrinogen oxidase